MPAELARRMLLASAVLAVFAVAGALLVASTWQATAERIAANERAFLLKSLEDVLPEGAHDNALAEDMIEVTDAELLGTGEPVAVYRARRGGEAVAVVISPVAPDGYSGPIRLLVGILADGTVSGVRVVAHRETPGLGDKIEVERSPWILGFSGTRLGDPPESAWAVRRDGGAFDQMTGATVTPRAVVKAVKNALIYFRAHRERLMSAPAQSDAEGAVQVADKGDTR